MIVKYLKESLKIPRVLLDIERYPLAMKPGTLIK